MDSRWFFASLTLSRGCEMRPIKIFTCVDTRFSSQLVLAFGGVAAKLKEPRGTERYFRRRAAAFLRNYEPASIRRQSQNPRKLS